MLLRLKAERLGDHIHGRVFVGADCDHLALAGKLTFRIGEWQLFGAALLLGAKQMQGYLTIECPDDAGIVPEITHREFKDEQKN